MIFQQKLHEPEGNGTIYSSEEREKPATKNTQRGSCSHLKEKSKASQTSKSERIQQHQASFTTNARGTYLGRKRATVPQTLRKQREWVISEDSKRQRGVRAHPTSPSLRGPRALEGEGFSYWVCKGARAGRTCTVAASAS